MQYPQWIWHNGTIKPWAEATTHVMSHALHYGSSVFEGIRCYETASGPAIFRLTDHNRRLYLSAKIHEIDIPYSLEELNAACREVISANGNSTDYLRPVAYRLPSVEGLPDHTLALFEVVELQDQATALARLAEYFAEMGQMKQALAVVGTLIHHFPEDTGGAAARAQVAAAQRDRPEFSEAVRVLLRGYSQPEIDALDWERRVSVALVLAQAQRAEAARATLQACLSEVDEARLRSLSPAALYRLILAARTMGLGFEEMPLYPRALEMLPPEMQAAVSPAR